MNIFAEAARLYEQNTPFALASIIETKGSAPRHDAIILVLEDGTTRGTIGGGMIERHVIGAAIDALKEGRSRVIKGSMSRTGKDAMDMDCGGTMTVHIDVQGIRPDMLLIGGGHVNRAVAKLASELGYRITVVDSWEPNLNARLFPPNTQLILGATIQDAISQATIRDNTQVIIATNHEDTIALPTILNSSARYIGQLASRRKVETLHKKCLELGISEARFQEVRTPVGLDIGAESPEEIAVSIMGEILALSRGKLSRGKGLRKGDEQSATRSSTNSRNDNLVMIRGAGDLASGTAVKLHNSGFKVVMLDLPKPTVIRTNVSFAGALLNESGQITVEGITAHKARSVADAVRIMSDGRIPIMADPDGQTLRQFKPAILVDGILAKQNLGTNRNMAPITIALGPGFHAGQDVDAVIETCRGHNLARVIYQGAAEPNTGKPGTIMGYAEERVLRAPCAGTVTPAVAIGDLVEEGQVVAQVRSDNGTQPVITRIGGKVRGMISTGSEVTPGFKIGDIDPRGTSVDHTTVSDKARAIAGGVLEAILKLSAV
ncbi:selenium-dependent molybdenum cofactor biosynthesis protein YqeB [Endozoicomonas sp. SCSIO W0465]|uniref:selenium-dependent molybdenum cofactor biosynthesis protein YqeB n=1 Tax=Endozoicomonas sp. SCSIO W0465 TaxID=2918516 RepID=UPI0020759D86|nr:selenium-dependent molybdenum cofactor biosynthesis protein YqeB [Endozoicomonas sp. SCSIO W0465]USE37713.1 EF2563 family selenium-dependent molybdenum hydroxylase system protein [Endozoicomonas sp. SCSIO W0465]